MLCKLEPLNGYNLLNCC